MGSGVCLLDYDNDHDLDIYFCQGSPLPGWDKNINLENKLFQNDDGRWTDVTAVAGVGDKSYSTGCTCGDVDNDGDMDLYVTNFGKDIFYRNNGNGTFTDVTSELNILTDASRKSMQVVFHDFNDDGFPYLFVANDTDANGFYLNRGDCTFKIFSIKLIDFSTLLRFINFLSSALV